MIKKVNFFPFFLIFLLLIGCSFDKKTGIWDGVEDQKRKIEKLRADRKRIVNTVSLYSTQDFVSKCINSSGIMVELMRMRLDLKIISCVNVSALA